MKILLVYPTITIYGKDRSAVSPIPPLGLAYIAAYMEKLGHTIKILDCVAEGIENVNKVKGGFRVGLDDTKIAIEIKKFSPDIVGISSMFSAYAQDAYRIAFLVKNISKEILVVFGGAHACALTDDVLKNKTIDLCVIGEGELTFAEIVDKFSKGKPYLNINGVAYKKMGKVIFTSPRELINDLDVLPLPARHLLPMDIYLNKHKNPFVYYDRHTFMISSRGCPMNCVYCSIHAIWKNKWRSRSPESVVDEIEYLVKQYGIKEIHFVDDNLTVNKKRAGSICDLIIKRKLNIKWTGPNGVAIWTLDEKLLDKMKKSGCYRLTFGIESGSQQTQKFIRKNLNLEYARDMIAYCNKIGIWTLSTFIVGFPYQDKDQIEASINYAIKSKTDFATFYVLMPFPSTDVWNILIRENLLKENEFFNEIGYYLSTRGVTSKYFNHEQIQFFASLAHKKVLKEQIFRLIFTPGHYLKKIQTRGDLAYAGKLLKQFGCLLYHSLGRHVRVGGAIYRKSVTRE